MANENKASYAKIGLAVVLGVLATIATLVYIGGVGSKKNLLYVETYYDKPVSGLSIGSTVNFRGVKIGEVVDINLLGNEYDVDGNDGQLIYILMALDRNRLRIYDNNDASISLMVAKMVKHGLRATVTASGITGLSRIEYDIHPSLPPLPQISWRPQHVFVPPKPSLLEDFSASATKVMNQINKMDLTAFWSNLNSIVTSLAAAGETTRTMLEERQPEIEKILTDFSETTSALKEFSNQIKQNPSLLIRETRVSPLPETTP